MYPFGVTMEIEYTSTFYSCNSVVRFGATLQILEYLPWAGSFLLHIFCKHSWADCLTARQCSLRCESMR